MANTDQLLKNHIAGCMFWNTWMRNSRFQTDSQKETGDLQIMFRHVTVFDYQQTLITLKLVY